MKADVVSNSRTIAQFVAETRTRRPPEAVLDAARMCLVDWVAVATGAQGEPVGRVVRDVASRWNAQGRSTLLLGGASGAVGAALCNGTLAHCLDFDDTYVKANTHTSAPLWAATLAMGEDVGASEREMLCAFLTGFEVSARIGYGLGEAVTARGFHATGVFGRLAAAAACAALMKLETRTAQHALGVAATQASGLVGSFGTMSKPFHAGKAAMDGVLSAQLAAAGFEAATHLFDPGGGFDTAIIQDKAVSITPADFSSWEILGNSFKPYAACHLTHPAIDAARELGLTAADMARAKAIRIDVGALAHQVTGEKSGAPPGPMEAKFDLKYCVALALTGRPISAADFVDPLPEDPRIPDLVDKMTAASHPACGYASAAIEVVFDGAPARRIHIPEAKGHPGNPMTWDDMRAKFEGLVEPVAGASTQAIFDSLRDFGGESGSGLKTIRMLSAALND
ncbi:MmgE/PrpD family protein [Aquabacter spiritensis]|uniref:2-methylcitrate dehydratase PrpD n=1 Tax=Aquabacter spiritensis TaxID=933073 RepID=A0A4R3LW69_9HYPH|nr:MmgE/PrpD family protein [Aquabacter spiritensis]TCT04366.1 2-methylcitrate dehydratase PrpD [Aquabacter spiritensis]